MRVMVQPLPTGASEREPVGTDHTHAAVSVGVPHTPVSVGVPHTPGPRPRVLVALSRARLRRATGARAGRVLAGATALGFAIIAVVLRVADGQSARFSGLVEQAVRSLAFVVSATVAFTAADDRESLDREDGIDTLVSLRGGAADVLAQARAAAAMLEITLAIAVPALLLTALTVVLAGSALVALRQVAMSLPIAIFAVACGVTLGFVASTCNRLAGRRGRWLLAAVLLGPWLLADLAGNGAWSIPGALDALFSFTLRLLGGGGRP